MCLNPIKLRSLTKRLSLVGGQKIFIEVPCNKCAECKKQSRLLWHFRSYHQCKEIIDKGGFVLFDTLTYDDTHLPHISDFIAIEDYKITDFSCFNNDHWKNFLKNLRRQLSYHYKKYNVTFKYFLTSEYGTDDRYTHRPHYHVLFFVLSNGLLPAQFSKLINKCWPYGRTDGIDYKTSKDFYEDNVFTEFNKADVLKVCSYITKYVTKDSTYQRVIDNRLTLLKDKLSEELYKDIKYNISQFHRQSQGFGKYYLDKLSRSDYDTILRKGIVTIEDNEKVKCVLKLPLYYERKLFYTYVHNMETDTKTWLLNPQGVIYTKNKLLNHIETLIRHYTETLLNYPVYSDCIKNILGNRTLEDFAIYKLFYQGRTKQLFETFTESINRYPELTDIEYNLYDWINQIIKSRYVNGSRFLSDEYLNIDKENKLIEFHKYNLSLFDDNITETISLNNNILRNLTFNENSCIAFVNFDMLDNLFKAIVKNDNVQKQITFDFIENLSKKLNILYENNKAY